MFYCGYLKEYSVSTVFKYDKLDIIEQKIGDGRKKNNKIYLSLQKYSISPINNYNDRGGKKTI